MFNFLISYTDADGEWKTDWFSGHNLEEVAFPLVDTGCTYFEVIRSVNLDDDNHPGRRRRKKRAITTVLVAALVGLIGFIVVWKYFVPKPPAPPEKQGRYTFTP